MRSRLVGSSVRASAWLRLPWHYTCIHTASPIPPSIGSWSYDVTIPPNAWYHINSIHKHLPLVSYTFMPICKSLRSGWICFCLPSICAPFIFLPSITVSVAAPNRSHGRRERPEYVLTSRYPYMGRASIQTIPTATITGTSPYYKPPRLIFIIQSKMQWCWEIVWPTIKNSSLNSLIHCFRPWKKWGIVFFLNIVIPKSWSTNNSYFIKSHGPSLIQRRVTSAPRTRMTKGNASNMCPSMMPIYNPASNICHQTPVCPMEKWGEKMGKGYATLRFKNQL